MKLYGDEASSRKRDKMLKEFVYFWQPRNRVSTMEDIIVGLCSDFSARSNPPSSTCLRFLYAFVQILYLTWRRVGDDAPTGEYRHPTTE